MGRTEEHQKQAALTLTRRLPPQDLGKSLAGFLKLAPHLEEELLQRVDRPLEVSIDTSCNRPFIISDFNADGDSHRSPWSNKYLPERTEDDAFFPSARLRKLEVQFNEVFDSYKTCYYDGGVSSVYLWDLEEGFAGAFLIHKEAEGDRGVNTGGWDSIHVVEVMDTANGPNVTYILTTTVMLHLQTGEVKKDFGRTDIGGYIQKQAKEEKKKKQVADDTHLLHIGKMIEEMESSIRKSMDAVYVQKHREVMDGMRSIDPLEENLLKNLPVELNATVSFRSQAPT